MSAALDILLGAGVVLAITALTGWFVAQEFGYMSVDRARLRVRAGAGDAKARRALAITGRTSFMLSGAQLGITVTGLVVGYVAEPLIGAGLGELLGGVGVPTGAGVAIGTVAALLFATVVQMVFGELFPKNLAIARPEPVARALALSTSTYLMLFGWLIRLFDASSNLLLRALRIERVHDVEHSATPRDLEAIIDESRERGDLRADLSAVLDRVLEFEDRPARAAMIPRPRVATAPADATVGELVEAHGRGPLPLPRPGRRCRRRRRRGLPARRARPARGAARRRAGAATSPARPWSSPTRCTCPPCWRRCAPRTTSSRSSSTSTAGSPAC